VQRTKIFLEFDCLIIKFDLISVIFRLHGLSTVFRIFFKNVKTLEQARNQGGARGAFATPPPTGPHFDTQYPSSGVQPAKLKF